MEILLAYFEAHIGTAAAIMVLIVFPMIFRVALKAQATLLNIERDIEGLLKDNRQNSKAVDALKTQISNHEGRLMVLERKDAA